MGKLNNISVLRVLSMFLIFSFHVVMGILGKAGAVRKFFPLFFAVQIFMFITGFLYSNKKIDNKAKYYKKRLFTILLPYYIYVIVLMGVVIILDVTAIDLPTAIQTIFCAHVFTPDTIEIEHFWYLFYVVLTIFLLPLLIKLYNKNKNAFCVTISIIVILEIILAGLSILNVFNYQIVLSCFIFGFMLGKKYNTEEQLNQQTKSKKKLMIISLLIFILSAILYCIFSIYSYKFSAITLFKALLNWFVPIMALSFSVFFVYAFKFLNDKPLPSIVAFFDKYSYFFYITHQVFLLTNPNKLVNFSLLFVTKYLPLNVVIAFVASLITAIILQKTTGLILIRLGINKKVKQ